MYKYTFPTTQLDPFNFSNTPPPHNRLPLQNILKNLPILLKARPQINLQARPLRRHRHSAIPRGTVVVPAFRPWPWPGPAALLEILNLLPARLTMAVLVLDVDLRDLPDGRLAARLQVAFGHRQASLFFLSVDAVACGGRPAADGRSDRVLVCGGAEQLRRVACPALVRHDGRRGEGERVAGRCGAEGAAPAVLDAALEPLVAWDKGGDWVQTELR